MPSNVPVVVSEMYNVQIIRRSAYVMNDHFLDTIFYGMDIKRLQGISILYAEGQSDTCFG